MLVFLIMLIIIISGLLISLILPGFSDDINMGFYLFITAFFGFSAFVMLLRKRVDFFRTLSGYIAVFLTLFVIGEGVLIYFSGDEIPTEKEEAIVVSGAGLFVESRMTAELEKRIDKAIEIYEKNPDLPIFLSGGTDENRALPQCVAMQSYLEKKIEEKGMDMPMIITDSESSGIYENIISATYKNNGKPAYIIVSRHNVARTKLITNRVSPESVVIGAEYPISKYVVYYIREFGYAIKTFLCDGLN